MTTEDLCFKLRATGGDRFVLVRDDRVFDMLLEDRTDYGHTMADGLDISSKPVVSAYK